MSTIVRRLADADLRVTDERTARNAASVSVHLAIELAAFEVACTVCGGDHDAVDCFVPCVVCQALSVKAPDLCAAHEAVQR